MPVNRHLDPDERLTNVQAYGEPCPWEQVNSHPVYTIEMECREGREVELTRLRTFEHKHTEEVEKSLADEGEIVFVFRDEWPEDDVIRRNGVCFERYVKIVA